jgi:tRNA nucleotidyltransferase/poly(A) polymerase
MSKDRTSASPYAGRWVAVLRDRVIAQGGTPELARRAAKASRHKEKPEIIFMPASFPLPPLIETVRQALPADQEIHLVGGAVRDMLLGRVSHDLDFAVPSNGVSVGRRVANALQADYVTLDHERDTGRVIVTGPDGARTLLDFATYRGGASIEDDLRGRDLTINAIAYDLRAGTILDPLEGGADLRAKRLRACSAGAFSDDPVRVLRAVRLAAALGFQIEPETRKGMKLAAAALDRVSPERSRDEIFKLLEGPKPDASMRALEMLGALPAILPELPALKGVEQPLPHISDVWTHTLAVLGHLESILSALRIGFEAKETNDLLTGMLTLKLGRYRNQFADHLSNALNTERSVRSLLFFAALYHDISKPGTRTSDETGRIRFLGHDEQGAQVAALRGEALRLSNDEVERLRVVIANHMRFHFHSSRLEGEGKDPSRRAIYRFFRDAGVAGVDLVLLGLADLRAVYAHTLRQETWGAALSVARIFLENFWERPQESVSPPRLLDGNELMHELDLPPGPAVGRLLEAIREAQAAGKLDSRTQGLEFARTWLQENPQ